MKGMGFVKKDNQIEAYGKILDFLDKYLKKEEEEDGVRKGSTAEDCPVDSDNRAVWLWAACPVFFSAFKKR